MYFVSDKHQIEVGNKYIRKKGGFRIGLNYPNKYDAAKQRSMGLISSNQEAEIGWAWRERKPTDAERKLGPGIDFQGWSGGNKFPSQMPAGKIIMHRPDIKKAFDNIAPGTMVVIF